MTDTPFNVLMEQAVKLKGQEMDSKKKRFLQHPEHVQHTVYHKEDVVIFRNKPMENRIAQAIVWKEEGNAKLESEDVFGAIDVYEKALGLFHWIENSDPEWRKNGIQDAFTKEHTSIGSSDHDRAAALDVRVALLGNLCLAHQSNAEYSKAVATCTYGVRIAPGAAKLWYRRAKARLASPGAGATELNMAIADLRRGAALLADASTRGDRRLLAAIRKELRNRIEERRLISDRDKTAFQSMFDLGRIYPEDEGAQRKRRKAGSDASTADEDSGVSEEKEAEDLLRVADAMERDGREDEAIELRDHVRAWRERKAASSESHAEGSRTMPETGATAASMNFSNPTPAMVEDAKRHGIDLSDPDTVAELVKLQQGIARQTSVDPANKMQRKRRAYFLGAIAATLFMLWRLYMSGMLTKLFFSKAGDRGR